MQGSNPNIYDSWRSQQHVPPPQPRFVEEDDFYNYDSHDPYNDPHPKLYPPHVQPQYAGSNRYLNQQYMYQQQQQENMYPYSGSNYSNSRKYYRDYDPNF